MSDNLDLLNVLLVAAIDFGTTFSGYGFAFPHSKDNEKNDDPIYLNKNWGQNLGCQSYKAPTTVLFGPDKKFIAFGFEAVEKYATLTENGEDKSYYFFEHFKMRLHSNHSEIRRDMPLAASNGKTLPALDVFSKSLKFLSDHLREAVKINTGTEIEASSIRWVITVPAIWSDAAKHFMREAAYKAGIASLDQRKHLLIALEPEAASLFCRQLNVSKFREDTDKPQLLQMDPENCYMVVDCGGGTVDVTVHKVRDDGSMRELHRPTGGPWGGTKVDSNFSNLLEQIFGKDLMNEYRRKFPRENVQLMADFEMKKRSAADASVQLNYCLVKFLESTLSQNIAAIVSDSRTEGVRFSNGLLRLSKEVMYSLFQPVLEQIMAHIQSLLTNPKLRNIKTIFLVGGFADSPLLWKAVVAAVPDRKVRVLVPEEACLAVIKGAVMFGLNPNAIRERVSARTYGVRSMTTFIEGLHPPQKKVVAHGLVLATDIFNNFVGVDELVELQYRRSLEFKAVRDDQRSATVYLFSTSERDPQFTTDHGMSLCGRVHVDMPDTRGGRERVIRVTFIFGGTEIDVQAEDLTSHMRAFATIDFLTKHNP
ncbi:PREDICTED: heat shock 70 kDa protein 12A-like [Branchiostoma belcheri]|uniref:Heat shock 70 kDa protein 12A-like n=1 Tax=Branchiostoma belcheri TaxID=7741 RepID=A0A6P4YXC1_BRABE|nr:PREDICTED: heat shock 70 kDa protein 12A-like [Branchiostoma belcheri]